MDKEHIYKLLFEYSGQGMVLRHGEKIILANQSFAELCGYSVEELLAFSMQDALNLIHPEDREMVMERFHNLLAGNNLPKTYDYRFIRRNGETGWWTATVSVIKYQGQQAVLGIYNDITERKKAEEIAARGGKLLDTMLNVLPVGVCLTDQTGHYRMMNDAYCAIYDYEPGEMIGKHFGVIMPPDQVTLAIAQYPRLLQGDVGLPVERKRRKKDGRIVYIEAANALVENLDGEKMVITTVRDITARKQSEDLMRLRLSLLEYAAGHSLNELLKRALDEIGRLTDSPIAFFHFVEEDKKLLSLQAWTNTDLHQFYNGEGQGKPFPLAEAGLWEACVAQQKPIISNNYTSAPPKDKYLEGPAGHQAILRELVVPVVHEGQVVAILGVGNKPFNYNAQDADMLVSIADLVWSIADRKLADEKIRQLNAQLERLAMKDDLTGLLNRRAFFMEGAKEIARAQRYATPFSFLMLDLDSFKQVNDNYGHQAGDLVLQGLSQLLANNVRQNDIIARMGGEEFSVLLPNTGPEDAVKLAERIRESVDQEKWVVDGQSIHITVSVGVASYTEKIADLETIIKRADDAMYQAKAQGRNRVVFLEHARKNRVGES